MTSAASPKPSGLEAALAKIARRVDLDRVEARAAMEVLLRGEAPPSQVGAFILGLRVKGERVSEAAGLVDALRAACVRVLPRRAPLLDLCGTGGDGSGTFNISTATALVAVGAGAAVAKHGNRAASSRCGSADVLEALGVPIDLAPERAARAIDELGFAFLLAPAYHPAVRHVAAIRRELGVRTIFNLLGPLANPAGASCQLLGVFEDEVRPLVARVLQDLGCARVWVVHSRDGLDELSPSAPTEVTEVREGSCREFTVDPGAVGLAPVPLEGLRGGSPEENAAIIESVLAGRPGPARDAVLLNSAAALVVAGIAEDLRLGMERARESIDRGSARRVLEDLRRFR